VEVHSTPIESNGRALLLSIVHDVTERKLAQDQVRKSINEQRAILDSNVAGIVKLKDRHFVWMNHTYASMLGYAEEELVGQSTRLVYVDDQAHADFAKEAYPAIERGAIFRNEVQYIRKDGSLGWYDISGEQLGTESAESIWSFIDITERKTAEDRLAQSESKLKGILEGAADAIFIANPTGHYQYVNKQASLLLGFSHDEFMAMSLMDITPPEDLGDVVPQFKDGLMRGGLRTELRLKRKDGTVIPVELNASLLPDGNMYGACRDITLRQQMEENIRQLAFHDTLTGLPNRRLLSDRLELTLMTIKRSGRLAAVMFIDLDNFKPLNDMHGHEVGDMLLIEVANRLKACVREIDTVARMGGDEFVVMLGELDLAFAASKVQAVAIAEKVRMALAQTYQLTVQHTGQLAIEVKHHCTASIGVVVFGGDEGSQEDILKWADAAMYAAKDAGRNVVKLYDHRAEGSAS
jgi:diguanylate cyclase (GGDEF)-like protein/PAS domain S-box-containing protein